MVLRATMLVRSGARCSEPLRLSALSVREDWPRCPRICPHRTLELCFPDKVYNGSLSESTGTLLPAVPYFIRKYIYYSTNSATNSAPTATFLGATNATISLPVDVQPSPETSLSTSLETLPRVDPVLAHCALAVS